jgi:hypothetical protein
MADKKGLLAGFGALLCYFGFGGALTVLAWDGYQYWRSHDWKPVSVIAGMRSVNVPWALEPGSWFALWNSLYGFPLAAAFLVFGLVAIPIYLFGDR